MTAAIAQAERRQRIDRVIDYIFTHLDQDLSIETLSRVVHYSPFHLQKLFKAYVGQTPKQYALRLRLETAFHQLVIHPQKSIQEIAFDGGFSSPATFTRAIRNHFGHAPEQLRKLPHAQKMRLLHSQSPGVPVSTPGQPSPKTPAASLHPSIQVLHKQAIKGVYILVPFNRPDEINQAFRTLTRFANAGGYMSAILYGVLAPHQRNGYKAILPIPGNSPEDLPYPICDIPAGAYARFAVSGDWRQVNKVVHYFLHRWLPDSGYKISGITGFETFSGDPATTPYGELRRHIHIPIEAAL